MVCVHSRSHCSFYHTSVAYPSNELKFPLPLKKKKKVWMMVVGIHGFCSCISGLPLSVVTLQASCLLLSGFTGLVRGVSSWGQLAHVHKKQHGVPSPGEERTLSTPRGRWGRVCTSEGSQLLGPVWPPPFDRISCEEFVSDQGCSCMVCWSTVVDLPGSPWGEITWKIWRLYLFFEIA